MIQAVLVLACLCRAVSLHSLVGVYAEHRLEELCTSHSKQRLSLAKQPIVLTFDSHNTMALQCHIELQLHSGEFGFFVFIETLQLDTEPACKEDFLQFGRDFAFLTSYKSKKYCERIEPTTTITLETESGLSSSIDVGSTSTSAREYVETSEQDMDIWLSIQPPLPGARHKEVRLVVTPFKKSCSTSDTWWWPCSGTGQCVRRDLLCDGVLNCAGGDEQADVCVTRVYPAGLYISLPLVVVCGVCVVCCVLCVLGSARLTLSWAARGHQSQAETAEEDRVMDRLKSEDREMPPTAPPPPDDLASLPPSYREAVSSAATPHTYSYSYSADMGK